MTTQTCVSERIGLSHDLVDDGLLLEFAEIVAATAIVKVALLIGDALG